MTNKTQKEKFDKKKFIEDNAELVAKSRKDLKNFLISCIVFIGALILISTYYLIKTIIN